MPRMTTALVPLHETMQKARLTSIEKARQSMEQICCLLDQVRVEATGCSTLPHGLLLTQRVKSKSVDQAEQTEVKSRESK
jgi:hypothetical protein